ncbi:MAG: hypothetical protein R3A13_11210 [Bdellovibrionota bacterium]
MKSLLRASKILRNHYGEVILRFAEPIKISSILDKENLKKPEDIRKQTTKLAYLITDRIRLSSDISFTALAFTALMSSSHYGLKLSELENSVIELSKLAAVMKALNPAIGDLTPSLEKFLNGNKELILDLPRTGIAKLGEYAGTPVISIPGDRRFTADFYRNATSHLFLPAAILAASELINGEILLKDISMFRTCFALEYLLPENDEFLSTIEQLINYLLKVEILAKVENKLYFKTRAPGMFNPRLILGSIQSMLYVFDSLRERQSKQSEWPLKELIKNLHDEFKAASYIAKFNRTEASAKSSIESALDSLRQIGIISIKEDDKNGKLVGISNDQAEELVFLINANKAILDYR